MKGPATNNELICNQPLNSRATQRDFDQVYGWTNFHNKNRTPDVTTSLRLARLWWSKLKTCFIEIGNLESEIRPRLNAFDYWYYSEPGAVRSTFIFFFREALANISMKTDRELPRSIDSIKRFWCKCQCQIGVVESRFS